MENHKSNGWTGLQSKISQKETSKSPNTYKYHSKAKTGQESPPKKPGKTMKKPSKSLRKAEHRNKQNQSPKRKTTGFLMSSTCRGPEAVEVCSRAFCTAYVGEFDVLRIAPFSPLSQLLSFSFFRKFNLDISRSSVFHILYIIFE